MEQKEKKKKKINQSTLHYLLEVSSVWYYSKTKHIS